MAEQGEPLSEREQAVLERMAIGSTNREIALELSISPNTVKVHVRNIFVKLGVSSRTEATTVAIQKGLLTMSADSLVPGPYEVEQQTDRLEDAQEAADELRPAEVAEPETARPWRIIAFVLILAAGLLIGAMVSAWLRGDGGDATPTSAPSATVEPFIEEPIGDSHWRVGRPLPRGRADMAVASVGLDLYVIGGEVDAGVVNLVDVYETKNGQWQSAASKPTAVADATAAVLFGEIVVPGGQLADGQPTSVVEAYSPANNAWRPVGALPTRIAGGLALSDGSRLYLLGGWDGERYLADAYVYDPAADAWESLPPMTVGRADAAGDLVGDRLYVVGGFDGQRELDACEYFDLAVGEWFSCANMRDARAGAGASAQGNGLLYIVGGGKEGGVSQGEVLDVRDDSWEQVVMPMLEAHESWPDLGVASVETRIYALGGRQNEAIMADNYTFAPLVH
ncbi:MAG: hypothetical protein JSW55_07890, partial [Chloroflexota bacterium]